MAAEKCSLPAPGGATPPRRVSPPSTGAGRERGTAVAHHDSICSLMLCPVSCVLPWARSHASDSSSCAMLRTKGGMSHFAEGETGSEGVVHSFIQFILTKPLLCVRQTDKSHVPAALVG